jgi:hypothetical protein
MQTQTKPEVPALTAEDRCDTCSAAAKVRAIFLNGQLLFCGHHAKRNKDSLVLQALTIHDEEGFLWLGPVWERQSA